MMRQLPRALAWASLALLHACASNDLGRDPFNTQDLPAEDPDAGAGLQQPPGTGGDGNPQPAEDSGMAGSSDGAGGPDASGDAGQPDAATTPGPAAPPEPDDAPGGVDAGEAGTLIFTELMPKPDGGADSEWIELYNAGSAAVNLGGCAIAQEYGEIGIDSEISVAPGSYVLLGREDLQAETGLVADHVYEGFSLGISEILTLRCGGEVLDQIEYGSDQVERHQSLQLDARYAAAGLNGTSEVWCLGTSSIGNTDDQGTPGEENAPCQAVPEPETGGGDSEDGDLGNDPENPGDDDGILTCRYSVFGNPACIDYLKADGWTAATAEPHCNAQFSASDVEFDHADACLSDDPDNRCVATDDQGRTYYAHGSPEGICTDTIGGTYETRPGGGWPAY